MNGRQLLGRLFVQMDVWKVSGTRPALAAHEVLNVSFLRSRPASCLSGHDNFSDVAPSFNGSIIGRCENAQDRERPEDVYTLFAVAGDQNET